MKRIALLISLAACNAPPAAKPTYADVDALPKELLPKSASATPAVAAPSAVAVAPNAGRARAPIASPAQAVAELQAAWTDEVLPAAKAASRNLDAYSPLIAETKRLSARRMECRAGHRRVDNTLGGAERTEAVLFAAIPVLDRDGDCWEVTVTTSAFNEILAYFDPGSGALLMVWVVPEG